MEAESKRRMATFAVLGLLLATSGASCPQRVQTPPSAAPAVFFGTPTVGQIVDAINANTSRVQQLQTIDARLAIEGLPRLNASLALERPSRFRLRGDTGLTGNELDLGSNDEVFWMWARHNKPKAVYFARHEEFRPGMGGILPLPPTWLIEALGLVTLDANTAYDGPHPRGPGRVELSYVTTGTTPLMKTLVVDDQRGHVLEQRVYDTSGQLLATAQMSDYRYDAAHAVSLPHVIHIQMPPAQLAFTFQIDGYTVNALYADPLALWSMPQVPDTPYLNLASH
jgi:hypothetical protein